MLAPGLGVTPAAISDSMIQVTEWTYTSPILRDVPPSYMQRDWPRLLPDGLLTAGKPPLLDSKALHHQRCCTDHNELQLQ